MLENSFITYFIIFKEQNPLNQNRNKKTNVLHLLLSLEVGGAERIVYSMMEKNCSDSFMYSACCLDSKGSYGNELELKGGKVTLLPRKPGIDWSMPWKLARLIQRERVDMIHAHGETPWFYGTLASMLLCGRVRCMTTVHGYGGGDRTQLEKANLWTMLTFFSHKVVVVSDILFNEISSRCFIPRKNMMTIINGVDIAWIDSSGKLSRKDWNIGENTKVLGTISRISTIKNHRLLLRSLERLTKIGQDMKLVIVGGGPERESLEQLTQELGVQEAVIFTGERSDAVSFFSLFDIFVLPSLSEGISMTILEAMASNTPVIASNVGGNNELITHEVNGFLFESENLDDLVQTILRVADNPEEARNAAHKSRQKVEREYSFERMVSQYEEIYNSAVG